MLVKVRISRLLPLATVVGCLVLLPACNAAEPNPIFQVDPDATGALTVDELNIDFGNPTIAAFTAAQRQCVMQELNTRTAMAGDPDTLDPSSVALLPVAQWHDLDHQAKRVILGQAIVTKVLLVCG